MSLRAQYAADLAQDLMRVVTEVESMRQNHDVGALGVEREFFGNAAYPATAGAAIVIQ